MDLWIDEEGEISIDSDHNIIAVNYNCRRVKRTIKPKRKPKWKLRCADQKMFSDKIYEVEDLTSFEAESTQVAKIITVILGLYQFFIGVMSLSNIVATYILENWSDIKNWYDPNITAIIFATWVLSASKLVKSSTSYILSLNIF